MVYVGLQVQHFGVDFIHFFKNSISFLRIHYAPCTVLGAGLEVVGETHCADVLRARRAREYIRRNTREAVRCAKGKLRQGEGTESTRGVGIGEGDVGRDELGGRGRRGTSPGSSPGGCAPVCTSPAHTAPISAPEHSWAR